MSKNLTAQQLADELGVTRQLIYYHAKKLPKNSKTYDDDNTLVFTPEQQDILKSYMTDTLKEKTSNKNEKKSEIEIEESLDSNIEIKEVEKKNLTESKENKEFNTIKNEEKTNEKVESSLEKKLTNADSNDKTEIVTNVKSTLSNVKSDDMDDDEGNSIEVASHEKSVTVKDFIQQVVKDHLESQKKIESEERQTLIGELEEKNSQISTLHKLLDQQQQLALVAEQKHQKLLETLGVEDETELKALVEETNKAVSEISSNTEEVKVSNQNPYEGKNWFQRLFKM